MELANFFIEIVILVGIFVLFALFISIRKSLFTFEKERVQREINFNKDKKRRATDED